MQLFIDRYFFVICLFCKKKVSLVYLACVCFVHIMSLVSRPLSNLYPLSLILP